MKWQRKAVFFSVIVLWALPGTVSNGSDKLKLAGLNLPCVPLSPTCG